MLYSKKTYLKETMEASTDKNYAAYLAAREKGDFKDLSPGMYVAFVNGLFLGARENEQALLDLAEQQSLTHEEILIQHADQDEHVYKIRGPRLARNEE
jgi:hypothetical protein